jgi:hypothetical protein
MQRAPTLAGTMCCSWAMCTNLTRRNKSSTTGGTRKRPCDEAPEQEKSSPQLKASTKYQDPQFSTHFSIERHTAHSQGRDWDTRPCGHSTRVVPWPPHPIRPHEISRYALPSWHLAATPALDSLHTQASLQALDLHGKVCGIGPTTLMISPGISLWGGYREQRSKSRIHMALQFPL